MSWSILIYFLGAITLAVTYISKALKMRSMRAVPPLQKASCAWMLISAKLCFAPPSSFPQVSELRCVRCDAMIQFCCTRLHAASNAHTLMLKRCKAQTDTDKNPNLDPQQFRLLHPGSLTWPCVFVITTIVIGWHAVKHQETKTKQCESSSWIISLAYGLDTCHCLVWRGSFLCPSGFCFQK